MFNDTPLDQMDGRYAKSMEGISPLQKIIKVFSYAETYHVNDIDLCPEFI